MGQRAIWSVSLRALSLWRFSWFGMVGELWVRDPAGPELLPDNKADELSRQRARTPEEFPGGISWSAII